MKSESKKIIGSRRYSILIRNADVNGGPRQHYRKP